ncbi:MAG TPA: CRTAC1 family protein, partial [Verrucomicrobia bacterium]|nr:CRTAC1 family protein [Verrucomicrobiota bacterium]
PPDFASRFGTTSMALADIDGDGDLDLYAANFGERLVLKSGARISTRIVGGKTRVTGRYAHKIKIINGNLVEFGAPDALFLNDGVGQFRRVSWSQGFFKNQDGSVMEEPSDFGLAVMFYDVNQDRHPDIFVCNDFQTPDRLWINDGQGRFNEMSGSAFRIMSYASMGVDFADIDRDGLPDIFVTEMLSRRLDHRKRQQMTLFRGESPGDLPQAPRNMLYHQRKDLTFSEIAWYSGVEASDWSWSPVFLDVDLDGYEDLLVTNGHLHNPNDRDRLAKRSDEKRTMRTSSREILSTPEIRVPNLLFRNLGNWKFREIGRNWGFSSDRISHGMALGDLDNDGDLDIVVNCLNEECLIYRNETTAPRIAVRLRGRGPNTMGVGARIEVTAGEMTQTQEILSGGRYLSGDDSIRVFAALDQKGTSSQIKVFWRSGKVSVISEVGSNRIYEIQEPELMNSKPLPSKNLPLFLEISVRLSPSEGNASTSMAIEFEKQPLLPYGAARIGSRVSWIDVDLDGRVDLVAGRDSVPGNRNPIRVYRFEKENMTFLSLYPDSNPEYLVNGVGGI